MSKGNKTQVPIESEFDNLNITIKDSNSVKNCSYCNKPFTEELWCKECDPRRMIEGWTSGNNDIDKFIKDTIYDARKSIGSYNDYHVLNIGRISCKSSFYLKSREFLVIRIKLLSIKKFFIKKNYKIKKK